MKESQGIEKIAGESDGTGKQMFLPICEEYTEANLISQAAYAKRRNVTRQAINKHIKNGTITLVYGKIDPDLADRQLEEAVGEDAGEDAEAAGDAGEEYEIKGLSLKEAKRRHKAWQAAREKVEYQERIGKLVKAKEVRIAAFSAARKVRDQMLNIPDRLAAVVAAETDQKKVHKIILEEIEKALEGI